MVQVERGMGKTDLDQHALIHPLVERLGDSPFDSLVLRIEVPVLLRRTRSLSKKVPRVCEGSSERCLGGSEASPHLEVSKNLPAADSLSVGRTELSVGLI